MDNLKKLNRDSMLSKLHSTSFHMFLTALTNEYCLEIEVITSNGRSYSWEGFDDFDFRAYRIEKIDSNILSEIKAKIISNSLRKEDLKNTQLIHFVNNLDDEKLSNLFSELLKIPNDLDSDFFCFKNAEDRFLYFFKTEREMADYLSETFLVDTKWEEMDDDSLREFLSRITDSEYEIPFTIFNEDIPE